MGLWYRCGTEGPLAYGIGVGTELTRLMRTTEFRVLYA